MPDTSIHHAAGTAAGFPFPHLDYPFLYLAEGVEEEDTVCSADCRSPCGHKSSGGVPRYDPSLNARLTYTTSGPREQLGCDPCEGESGTGRSKLLPGLDVLSHYIRSTWSRSLAGLTDVYPAAHYEPGYLSHDIGVMLFKKTKQDPPESIKVAHAPLIPPTPDMVSPWPTRKNAQFTKMHDQAGPQPSETSTWHSHVESTVGQQRLIENGSSKSPADTALAITLEAVWGKGEPYDSECSPLKVSSEYGDILAWHQGERVDYALRPICALKSTDRTCSSSTLATVESGSSSSSLRIGTPPTIGSYPLGASAAPVKFASSHIAPVTFDTSHTSQTSQVEIPGGCGREERKGPAELQEEPGNRRTQGHGREGHTRAARLTNDIGGQKDASNCATSGTTHEELKNLWDPQGKHGEEPILNPFVLSVLNRDIAILRDLEENAPCPTIELQRLPQRTCSCLDLPGEPGGDSHCTSSLDAAADLEGANHAAPRTMEEGFPSATVVDGDSGVRDQSTETPRREHEEWSSFLLNYLASRMEIEYESSGLDTDGEGDKTCGN